MNNTSAKSYSLTDVFGPARSKQEVLSEILNDKKLRLRYFDFPEQQQEELVGFLMGKNGLRVTYDTFFKKIFHPDDHPERLEALLGSILGQPIHIEQVLQREGHRLHGESSLVIMDIVVRLSDGSIMDVEIQKVGYAFPGERSCCYASDLIMRQYEREKQLAHEAKKPFSFRSMKPVYIIVIMENSPEPFLEAAPYYMHRKTTVYDSHVQIAELSNIIYISLDTFHKVVQNIDTPFHAWLTFLSAWKAEDILKLVNAFPQFVELYQGLAAFRTRTEDIMSFFSEALLMMDHGTAEYMCEEMKKEIAQLKDEKAQLKESQLLLANENAALREQLARLQQQ